ncbi:MAG: putative ABC transporter ATP-binding protein YxlF [bacterium]|nr:putative ABC transporter ATP-binding protein YxlF [bacterium]
MPGAALVLSGLTKRYGPPGSVPAVADLSLTIESGEIFAFLGPNGAGKTTTLKMVLGLIRPTAGSATLLDGRITDPRIRGRLGYLPEEPVLHTFLTVSDLLRFYAGLFGFSGAEAQRRIDRTLETVGMSDRKTQRLQELSKGLRQRVLLGQALINDPDLILLDEPQSGLDPVGITDLRRLLHELKSAGKTIFLNSHQLTEVEQVADRIGIIRQGHLIRTESTSAMLGGTQEWVVTFAGLTLTQADQVLQLVAERTQSRITLQGDPGSPQLFRCPSEAIAQEVIAAGQAAGGRLTGLQEEQTSLEQVFLQLMAEVPAHG